jgi:tetratricopeptide (TPR) repeat protein
MFGVTLAKFNQLDRAVEELERTIALEPLWGLPYAQLGMALESKGRAPEAAAQYEAFLARAARTNTFVSDVRQRLARIKS